MFFITLVVFNTVLLIGLVLYCKLTYGINKCSKHLVGKVVIVTGGSAGIGFETAKDLADRGAKVIFTSIDDEQGTIARDEIVTATSNNAVFYKNLDLASLASVRSFADEIMKTEKQLDVLINNAGIIKFKNDISEDGLNSGMQINYFGPFLLTNLLLPLLKSSGPSRIINVSSMAHRFGKIDFDNLNMEKETDKSFSFTKLYSNSKLCIVLMTVELARLLNGTGVTVNCLHPGAIRTTIMGEVKKHKPWIAYLDFTQYIVARSAWEGAQTTIYLATSPEVSCVSGSYFAECREQIAAVPGDTKLTRKLWEVSERLVKLK